ncbi:MAG TPA: ABC transporter ATP-binding protein [Candidatus Eisenbacteria bacterium]
MIEVEGLTKSYGPTRAISDLSFSVAKGEILGFLGPNGAGKTTTMRILTGFMPPAAGRVTIDGLDAANDSLAIRRRIGYLPESVPVYRDSSVADYLGLVADVKGVPRRGREKTLASVMEQCGLTGVRHRIVGRLSRGYRQRVGLAQALVNDPAVLILDEPTVGLDPAQVVEVRDLIRGLAGTRTVILSTHILPEVSQIASRILILDKGRIVAEGSPAELMRRLQGRPSWRVRVGGDTGLAQRLLAAVPGVLAVRVETPGNDGGTLFVETDDVADRRAAISRALIDGGSSLLELASADLTLEEIFLRIVGKEG